MPQEDTLLANFRVLEDTPDRTILLVAYVKDGRSWPNLIVHNEVGSALKLELDGVPIETDAKYFVAQQMSDAPGLSITAVGATRVAVRGKEVLRSADRKDFDQRM